MQVYLRCFGLFKSNQVTNVLLAGANQLVSNCTEEVQSILSNCVEEVTLREQVEVCNKETGERKSLRLKARGYMYIVTPGGFIEMFNPMYK